MVDTAFINAATYNSSSSNSAVVAKPTNTAAGDIMFALLSRDVAAEPNSVPDDWILLGINISGIYYKGLYYKIAGAAEAETYTWGWADAVRTKVTIATYRGGFNVSNPIDVVSNTAYNVNNATVRAASMNVSNVNSTLIFAGNLRATFTYTFTKPSEQDNDWVEDYDGGSTLPDYWHTFDHCNWSGSGESGVMDAISSSTTTIKHAFAVALNIEIGEFELSITENLELGDSRSALMTANISRTDGIKSGDTPSNINVLTALDNLKMGDSRLVSMLSNLIKTDGIKLSDSAIVSMIAEILATDGIKLSDNAIIDLFTAYFLSVTDGLKLSDIRTVSMFSEITKTDSLVLSDVAAVAKILLLLDGLKIGDSTSILPNVVVIDSMKIGDSSLISMLSQLLRTDGILLDDQALIGFAIIQLPQGLKRVIILIRDIK